MANILVVVAHADDEILGPGATLASLVNQGHSVRALIMSTGVGARKEPDSAHETKKTAAKAAARTLGLESSKICNFNDQRLDQLPRIELVQTIEHEASGMAVDYVLTHHATDLNLDHRVVYESVLTAFRPLPNTRCRGIFSFETPSASDYSAFLSGSAFTPNVFVDVTDTFGKKLEALNHYASEMREWPHPRSYDGIEVMARSRGAMAGIKLAEAFSVVYMRQNKTLPIDTHGLPGELEN